MTVSIERESVEYLKHVITADVELGGLPEYAFTQGDTRPASADWKAGAWLDAAVQTGTTWKRTARTPLIGSLPDLAAGTWKVWVRVTDTPEIPVEKFDTLLVR
jgi:hypothetical protein